MFNLQNLCNEKNDKNMDVLRERLVKLDNDFQQNMRVLSQAATTNHPLVRYCISHNMELYIQNKVDLVLAKSINQILKIKIS